MSTPDGKSTAHGYNAPCFESVVHNFVGSILMRWDNEDRKDRLSIALAIQNETKHFQVVSSNFQVTFKYNIESLLDNPTCIKHPSTMADAFLYLPHAFGLCGNFVNDNFPITLRPYH